MQQHIPEQRTAAPVELFDSRKLLDVIKTEIYNYYRDVLDSTQLKELNNRLSGATEETPFALTSYGGLINDFGGDDALGLRYFLAHRLGVSESKLPAPNSNDLRTYTLGKAIRDLRKAAGIEV